MDELLDTLWMLGATAPHACVSFVLMGFGILMVVSSGRKRPERGRVRVGLNERLDELGLEPTDGGWEGTVGGRRLRVTRIDDPTEDPPLLLELSTPIPFAGLSVGPGDPEQTAIRGSRHVGDSEFDPWFEVSGEPEHVAVLTFAVRRGLRNAARTARPRIERGWLTLSGPANVDLDTRIAPLFAVAGAIDAAAELDAGTRLRRFASDPDAGVRLRCLEMLQGRSSSIANAVARSRLDDSDGIVRTLAAVILKDSQRLVSIATSNDAAPGLRRRAARALLQTGSTAEVAEAARSLAEGPAPLHSVAYELSGSLGGEAEPLLITLVGSSDEEVAREAAKALAKTGSISAIPALREFHERTGKQSGKIGKDMAGAIQSMRPMMKGEPTRPLPDRERVRGGPHDHESPTGWRDTNDPATVRASRPFQGSDIDSPSQTSKPVQPAPLGSSGERRTPGARTLKRR